MKETQTFNIQADPELVDTTYIDQLCQADSKALQAERIADIAQHAGFVANTAYMASGEVWRRTGYAVVNSERAVRWLGRQVWLDMTGQK